jgi:hypothetical protein
MTIIGESDVPANGADKRKNNKRKRNWWFRAKTAYLHKKLDCDVQLLYGTIEIQTEEPKVGHCQIEIFKGLCIRFYTVKKINWNLHRLTEATGLPP